MMISVLRHTDQTLPACGVKMSYQLALFHASTDHVRGERFQMGLVICVARAVGLAQE